MRRLFCLVVLACVAGCAHYRFDLVQPSAFAGPLSTGEPRTFELDPLRYAVGTADDRVSIRVDNPTGDTIRLVGRDSSVVDPSGRSHPLIDQTIAPRAYVVVVLPPLRPWFGANGYVGTPGTGTDDNDGVGPNDRPGYPSGAADDAARGDDPGYDRSSPVFWDWPGPGDARVHLVYRRTDGSHFEHDLVVRRSNG